VEPTLHDFLFHSLRSFYGTKTRSVPGPLNLALGIIMDWALVLAFGGWVFALIQFSLTHSQSKQKNESELLEKTLAYFERGTQARSIAISLVEGIWLKNRKNLDIILPVLIAQATFLLVEADDYAQESRNLIRLLALIEKCLPFAADVGNETAEISEALLSGARSEKGVSISTASMKLWYAKFNNGDKATFEAETENS